MVHLLVRSPSVTTPDDFTVDVEAEHSIAEVKEIIEKTHSASPPARHMRVIWRGRILEDSSSVGDLYGESDDLSDVQTVHFVLRVAVANGGASSKAQKTESIISREGVSREADGRSEKPTTAKGKMNASYESVAESSQSEYQNSAAAAATLGTNVMPLGNAFQYVFVDGVPYLMELKEGQTASSQPSSSAEDLAARGSGRILLKAYADLVTRQSAIENRLRHVLEASGHTYSDGETGEGSNRGGNEDNRAAAGEERGRANQQRRAGNNINNNNVNENILPIPNVLRGFGMDAAWNRGWMLLRLLLLVVVLAHDASLERMLVLVLLAAGVMVFRSAWMQHMVRQLNAFNNTNNNNNAQEDAAGDRRRDYSTIEKARALVVALVTSLIPSEPLHAPAAAVEG
ncbi:hypothetical protein EV175_006348 [Coemansia sp. RSA 1933]|nr:hypothetical protein EV175_006348 [Coemansia sp. RSA 1933]